MKPVFLFRLALGLDLAVLAGCATNPTAPLRSHPEPALWQQQREQQLRLIDTWRLDGRLGVSDGQHGGSGQLSWIQRGEDYIFELHGPVFGPSFRLVGGPHGAVLTGLGKQPLHGPDAESLMRQALGWDVPLAELKAWVLGLRARGLPAQLQFGSDGLPAQLDQGGWQVRYPQWDTFRQPPVPTKVFASRPPYRLRLAIEHWQLGIASGD